MHTKNGKSRSETRSAMLVLVALCVWSAVACAGAEAQDTGLPSEEGIREYVRSLAAAPLSTDSGEPIFSGKNPLDTSHIREELKERLMQNGKVRVLFKLAETGSEPQKGLIAAESAAAVQRLMDGTPVPLPPGGLSVAWPDGALALPLLMAASDESLDSVARLVELSDFVQAAMLDQRQKKQAEPDRVNSGEVTAPMPQPMPLQLPKYAATPLCCQIVAGIERVLDRYADDEARRASLRSDSQRAAIESYIVWRNEVGVLQKQKADTWRTDGVPVSEARLAEVCEREAQRPHGITREGRAFSEMTVEEFVVELGRLMTHTG